MFQSPSALAWGRSLHAPRPPFHTDRRVVLPAFAGRCAPATSQIVSSPAAPLGMIGNEDMPAILPPTRFSTNGPTLFHCRPKVFNLASSPRLLWTPVAFSQPLARVYLPPRWERRFVFESHGLTLYAPVSVSAGCPIAWSAPIPRLCEFARGLWLSSLIRIRPTRLWRRLCRVPDSRIP